MGPFSQKVAEKFGYEKVIFHNGGTESVETAIKIARRWAVDVKGVPNDDVAMLYPLENYWGRSIAGAASTDEPLRCDDFGPMKGFKFDLVEYNDIEALEKKFQENPNIAGYLIEAIQADAGIIIPADDYLAKVKALCEKYKVLFIIDEIQTGNGRTGKLLCSHWSNVKPHMTILGKSLSGGFYPVSAVLADAGLIELIGYPIFVILLGSENTALPMGLTLLELQWQAQLSMSLTRRV